jgi:hypothetical protein
MNLLRLSAISILVVLLSITNGLTEARRGYGDQQDKTTTTTIKPTTTKRHHPKRTTTKAKDDEGAPSTAALEMTSASQLPTGGMETTSTLASILPESTPTTKAAPLITSTRKRGPKKPKTYPTLPPVDYDCKGKRDGYYVDPKDKCSDKYYSCVGGLARQMSCPPSFPPAHLVFDTDLHPPACVKAEDSFRCSGIRKTTPTPDLNSTTPRRPQPTTEKLPIDCKKMGDGWFADPDNKCSHVFYSCSNENGVRFECPGKKYFDQQESRCMDREEVEACGGKRPTTTTSGPTTQPPATTKSPLDCSEKPSGWYPDPENKCSKIYYACSNGDTIKRQCPPGDLFFDPTTSKCEYRDDIFACTGKTKPPPTTTIAPKPSPASLPSKEFKCTGKKDGGYTPEDKKCSQKFFKCIDGVAHKFMCAGDTYYDVESDKCKGRDELFVCTGRKPTPAITTTTTKPKPTEKLPMDCKSKKDGDFADPEKECSRTYYSCSGQVATRRVCPGHKTFFDKELGICDERRNVPACTGKPRPPTPRPQPPRPTKAPEKIPFDCSNKKNGWFADDKNKCSNTYYACVGGQASLEKCAAPDTFYDSGINQCGYREHVPDCGGVRPTEEPEE